MKHLRLIILLLLLNILSCILGGPPRTHMNVYNHRDETIFLIAKRTKMGDLQSVENNYEVKAKQKQVVSGDVYLHKPASKVYEYVIIKDENDNELINLRGETLNNAVTIETDDEDHVIYRLDVN